MTVLERKELYEAALSDYNEATLRSDITNGLCNYFNLRHDVNIYDKSNDPEDEGVIFKAKLPELYAQKPNNYNPKEDFYWWPTVRSPHKDLNRINALEAAIKLCEDA